MERSIYNFYCYQCFKENICAIPYPLECYKGKINRIYCPNCQSWISYKDTNLSQDRYKIVHINEWCIIDEDSKDCRTVYSHESYHIAMKICDLLNCKILSVPQIYSLPFIP